VSGCRTPGFPRAALGNTQLEMCADKTLCVLKKPCNDMLYQKSNRAVSGCFLTCVTAHFVLNSQTLVDAADSAELLRNNVCSEPLEHVNLLTTCFLMSTLVHGNTKKHPFTLAISGTAASDTGCSTAHCRAAGSSYPTLQYVTAWPLPPTLLLPPAQL
jgi:hypothetical protein